MTVGRQCSQNSGIVHVCLNAICKVFTSITAWDVHMVHDLKKANFPHVLMVLAFFKS
jgi:hypothetical protein